MKQKSNRPAPRCPKNPVESCIFDLRLVTKFFGCDSALPGRVVGSSSSGSGSGDGLAGMLRKGADLMLCSGSSSGSGYLSDCTISEKFYEQLCSSSFRERVDRVLRKIGSNIAEQVSQSVQGSFRFFSGGTWTLIIIIDREFWVRVYDTPFADQDH